MDIGSLITGIAGTLVAKGALEGPVNTFNDVWFATIGHYFSLLSKKREAKNQVEVEKYLKEISTEVSKVEEVYFKEPDISIIGPALDASKYYIENEIIRKAFAKLIGASFDTSKNNLVHHSFVEIIKQLSVIDAKILKNLATRERYQAFHVTPFFYDSEMNAKIMFGAFIDFDPSINQYSTLASFNNLERLGLIKLEDQSYGSQSHEEATSYSKYHFYKDNDIINNEITKFENEFNVKLRGFEGGWIKLTKFGSDFVVICLQES